MLHQNNHTMKKLFFIATLLALTSIAALAQVSETPKTITHGTTDFGSIPTVMTNGTLYMTNYMDGNIEIYDETLTKVKEIAVPTVTCPTVYTVTKEREYAVTLDEDTSSVDYAVYDWDEEKGRIGKAVLTLSEVMQHIESGFDSVYVDAQGNTLFLPTDGGCYQDSDNKKYPNAYYLWQVSTKYLFRYQCYYKSGYTGDWVESLYEYATEDAELMHMYYGDMTSGCHHISSFYATQTLFNTDDAFEYIQPLYSSPSASFMTEEDRDGDGETDWIVIGYQSFMEGVNIVSETGKVLQSVKLLGRSISSYYDRQVTVFKIGKTFYLVDYN